MQHDRRNKYNSVNNFTLCIVQVLFVFTVNSFHFLNLDCLQTASGLKGLNFMTKKNIYCFCKIYLT